MNQRTKKALDKAIDDMSRSKIVKFKLEEDVINLRLAGMSPEHIAEELSASGKLPEGESISVKTVSRFLDKLPQVSKELVENNKSRLLQVVDNNLDIVHEINGLYKRTKHLLDGLELAAEEKGKMVSPYHYKAVASEMRELLKQMNDINKDISDYNNIRKFMEIIMDVLRQEAPQSIPTIIERLKLAKGTGWFSEMLKR